MLGAADGDAARRLDGEHGEDAVIDYRREAPAAPAETASREIDLEPESARQLAVGVGEQVDLAGCPGGLPPREHHVGIVDRQAGDGISLTYDPGRELRDQVIDRSTQLLVRQNGIELSNTA